MNLSEKVAAAVVVLREAYEARNGQIFLSFSGGKDSTILRHIALSIYPNLQVVFSNTTNELTEVLKYVKTFENVIHVKPKLSFSEVVRKHGFPAVSKEVSQKIYELKNTTGDRLRNTRMNGDHKGNGILAAKWRFIAEQNFDVTHKCCKILKKDPLEKWGKENGCIPVIALMADESALRKQLALYGDNDYKVYPFLRTGWTEADIWEYANLHNIRFAECYYDQTVDGNFLQARTRTGCEFCAFGIHLEKADRFARSKLMAPKRFEKMMNLENNGVKFSEVIDMVKQSSLPKPELDLYGVKICSNILSNVAKNFFIENRHSVNSCPACRSKNIIKTDAYQQSFFDAPYNGMPRKLWVVKGKFECGDCAAKFVGKTPMINDDLGVTDRLVKFVDKVKYMYSFDRLMEETHMNRGRAVKVLEFALAGDFE